MAQDISGTVRSAVDRVLETDVQRQISRRGREMASVVAEAAEAAAARAAEAWQDSQPTRSEVAKSARRYGQDAAKWSRRTWRKELLPTLGSAWKRRTVAIGAAGAAVPAGKELIDTAAVRLGLKRQEQRHWTAFFLGLLLGALAGAAVAMLTAPKPGSQMREEIASRARDASDWVPIFQREPATNGHSEASSTALPSAGGQAEAGGKVDAPAPIEPSTSESQPS